MFSKSNTMAKATEIDNGTRNHIANGTVIKGDVIAEGNIRIDGKLEGTLSSKAKVVVGNTGVISGEISCQTASIEGKVDGKIQVSELLSIKSSGSFKGDMDAGKLEVQQGAVIEGTVNMSNNSVKAMKGTNDSRKAQEKSA